MSPLLLCMFINDLALEIRHINKGIYMGGEQCFLLMYADDIVLICPDVTSAQDQLNVLHNWCDRWCIVINQKKSQSMHIRNPQKKRCDARVFLGSETV